MPMTDEQKEKLLKLARATLELFVREGKKPVVNVNDPAFLSESGVFVTLSKNKGLRGCIGVFASPNPLYKTVIDMAVAASSEDPRFIAVDSDELGDVKIEISVLTPLKETKDTAEVEIGRHGLYITKGRHRGVLLPQVATEHHYDRIKFLEQTCLKAGLKPDDWKQGATIFTFEAEIFKEE
jgi:AmmeMemoRadiSam system protein A